MSKTCPNCGTEITSSTGFCPKCGATTESYEKELSNNLKKKAKEKKDWGKIIGVGILVIYFLFMFFMWLTGY